MTGADQSLTPMTRIMHALGSLNNQADFNLLLNRLNNLKSRLWLSKTLIADEKMEKAISADDPNRALIHLREPLTIISYLNHLRVQPDMIDTFNTIHVEFGRADTYWVNAGHPNPQSQARWDEWVPDLLDSATQNVRTFVENWGDQMYRFWAVRTGDNVAQTLEIIMTLRRQAKTARINPNGLD